MNLFTEENMDDRISNMPDEILFQIISSLPFESAIQTIFLSKRWKLLWQTALVRHGTERDFPDAIFCFLANFNEQDPSKNTRKFQFHFNNGNLLSAVLAPNSKLHLDFSDGKQESDRQFKLKLDFNNPENLVKHPSPSTFLIRNLHLKSVSCLTNDSVSSILTNFQFLEDLKITCCKSLQSLSIGSDTKILSLTIFDCQQLEFLHIRSFKLQTFRFRGLLPCVWPEYHYNLMDAYLDFRQGPRLSSFRTNPERDMFLLTIKNVKFLTLCKWVFQALICPFLSTFLAEFQFYNLKQLWWIDNYSGQDYDCDALISFLKLCPSLEQLFVTIDPKSYNLERRESCSIKAGGRNTKLKHLKMVKMDGFAREEDEIYLVECLREVIIDNDPLIFASSNHGIFMRRQIHEPVDRAKPEMGSSSTPHEDINPFCPKHVHMDI